MLHSSLPLLWTHLWIALSHFPPLLPSSHPPPSSSFSFPLLLPLSSSSSPGPGALLPPPRAPRPGGVRAPHRLLHLTGGQYWPFFVVFYLMVCRKCLPLLEFNYAILTHLLGLGIKVHSSPHMAPCMGWSPNIVILKVEWKPPCHKPSLPIHEIMVQ